MATVHAPSLTADDIDDLLYFARANDAEELQQTLAQLAQTHACSPADILSSCADPETKNTVLHYASANGLQEMVRSLLSLLRPEGVEAATPQLVNARNAEGNTALHWAAYNGQLEVVKLLIGAGADMWLKNAAGHLAMFEAERADKSDVVGYLLEAGGMEVENAGRAGAITAEDLEDVELEQDGVTNGADAEEDGVDVNMAEPGPSG